MQSVPSGFWDWINTLNSEEQISVLMFAVLAIILAIAVVGGTIYKMHKNRLDDALKRELLERGMSVEEIATVVRAKPAGGGRCGSRQA